MAGYYDEITGQFVDTGDQGTLSGPLDNTSGTTTYTGDTSPLSSNPVTNGGTIEANAGASPTPSPTLSSTLNDISKFISTNKGILGLGAVASLASSGGGGGGSGSSSAGIPNLVASRMQVPGAGSIVTPGQANQQYFTDTLYTDPSQQANAMAAIEAQAQAIAANRTNAPVPNFAMNYNNMPSTQNRAPLYTNYTPDQISNYINTSGINLNDPAAVAAATKTANANPAVVNQYIASLNKTGATTGVAALPGATNTTTVPGATKYTTYTPDQISNYIKTSGINLNDPAAVAAALKQANMDPAAFQAYLAGTKATGTTPTGTTTTSAATTPTGTTTTPGYTTYTPDQIANYIKSSGINLNDSAAVTAALKQANMDPAAFQAYLASIKTTPAGTTPTGTTPTGTTIIPTGTTPTGTTIIPTGTTPTGTTPTGTTPAGTTPAGTTPAGTTIIPAGTTTGTTATPKYTTYTPDQITNYIKTSGINLNDPAAVAAAEKQANMDPTAFQAYLASIQQTSAATPKYTSYTPDQITNYINSSGINLNDATAVAAAEKQANMDPAAFQAYQKSQDYNNFLNIIGKGSASTAPSTEAANPSGIASLPASNLVAGQTDKAISSDQVPAGSSGTAASTTATNAPANADTITQIVSQGQAAGQSPAEMAASLIAQGIPAADVIAVVGPQNADVVNQAYADASAYGGDTAAARGGLMSLNYAEGGATPPRYLQGHTDGMADELNTSIDGVQPAKLSHGEFVIPADVVSHLGNGNSDAGAKKLYEMMSRVRKARTGNEKQGKRIDPDKFMYGGRAYAKGGIASFDGTTGSTVSNTSGIPGLTNTGGTSTQGLSSYVAPYVTNMLGQGQALANTSMPVYQGPLTAGQSALQNQQFMGLSEMAQTGYNPMQFQTQNWSNQGTPHMPNTSVPSQTQSVSQAANQGTAGYGQPMNLGMGQGSSPASQYMNPYLSQSLQPQLNLLAQTAKTNEQGDLGKLTSQGAFGGSRQAVLQGMDQNALLGQQANLIGQGYNTAYNDAQAQFNADQQRQLAAQQQTEASRQFSGNFGQQTLQALGQAGGVQQGIQNAADQAAYAEFQKQQQYPYQQLAFEQSLLQGLPTGSTTTTPNAMSDLGTALAALGVVQNPALSSIFGSSTSKT